MIFEESIENKRLDIKHLKILIMKWKNKSNFIFLLVQKYNNFEFLISCLVSCAHIDRVSSFPWCVINLPSNNFYHFDTEFTKYLFFLLILIPITAWNSLATETFLFLTVMECLYLWSWCPNKLKYTEIGFGWALFCGYICNFCL